MKLNHIQNSYRICIGLVAVVLLAPDFGRADDVWRSIPSEAHSISVVRDMNSLSAKIDHVADTMGFSLPQVLGVAMAETDISEGLNLNGNLAWVLRPIPGANGVERPAMLYYLPASNFEKLIKPLIPDPKAKPQKGKPAKPKVELGDPRPVTVVGRDAFVSPLDSSAVFAFAEDRTALIESIDLGVSIRNEISPFRPWLSKQDAYVFVTRAGVKNGVRSMGLPLAAGNIYLGYATAGVSSLGTTTFAQSLEITQLATGIAIDPARGAIVSSRFVTGPNADLKLIFPDQLPKREEALDHLPGVPFAFALGGPVSPELNKQAVGHLKSGLRQQLENLRPATLDEDEEKIEALINLTQSNVTAIQLGLFPLELPAAKPEPAPAADLGNTLMDLAKSVVVVLKVDDSRKTLASIGSWFEGFPEGDAIQIFTGVPGPVERAELDGIPLLRSNELRTPDEELPQPGSRVMLAAASPNCLVLVVGTDAELKRALLPFRPNERNLMQAAKVRSSVQMLPEASAWVAVVDAHQSLALTLQTLNKLGVPNLLGQLKVANPEAPPLAFGVSRDESMLDLTVAAPNDLLSAIGALVRENFPIP